MRLNYIDNCDCLEGLKEIPDKSVDLIVTDPPYGTIRGQGRSPAAKNLGLDNCDWDARVPTEKLFEQFERVLRPNGKCVIFAQEPYTNELISKALPALPFCYRAIWLKNTTGNPLKSNKAMLCFYEDICVFSKTVREVTTGHPLRVLFLKELQKSGKSKRDAVTLVGSSATHYFTDGLQFRLPTPEKFEALRTAGFISLDYQECKTINDAYLAERYSTIAEETPSVFNLWQGGKSKSNVLEYPKDRGGLHPTQKPLALIEDLVQTFSNPGDVVLDSFMGSGTTAVACLKTGRNYIGFELDERYHAIAMQRVAQTVDELLGV